MTDQLRDEIEALALQLNAEARRHPHAGVESQIAQCLYDALARTNPEHRCDSGPPCTAWPQSVDAAYRTIAAVSWPGEEQQQRDGWAVTMRGRPDLFEREAETARVRLEAAIAHGRAALTGEDQ